MPTSQKVASCQPMRQQKKHRQPTTSDTNHNPRGAPISTTGSSAPGFVDSSGDPSGSTSDKPTRDTSPVTTIKIDSVPSETPTKYIYQVTKEFTSANPRNRLMEYPSGYPTGAPRNMPTVKPSSKRRYQTISDPEVLKQGCQEAQVSPQRYNIFILHIISPSSSRQRYTCMRRQGILRTFHIRVHKVYYENCALFSSTI